MITVGSDFSGVGAFNEALKRLKIPYKEIFACDMDKYARITFLANNGAPEYYPKNVYDRKIPKEPLDIYMSSPPCQSFSFAGKRGGENDERGVLFYNTHEFIQKNKPRYFIIENVKGLLSDDNGKTFGKWQDMLGGKSINGNPIIFPHEKSVPYHIYWKVLNAKWYNVPQNRERVFIVGIRDGSDNNFRWSKKRPLIKKLKDVLEKEVDEKYFLSDKTVQKLLEYNERNKENGNGFKAKFRGENEIMDTIKVGGGGQDDLVKIKSATKRGYEMANPNTDSVNFGRIESNKRRGWVGKECSQTITTQNEIGVFVGALRGRNPEDPNDRKVGSPTEQRLEINENGTSNTLTSVQKDNVVIQINPSKESGGKQPYQQNRVYDVNGISPVMDTGSANRNIYENYKIRRLTPREAFRLMDFRDSFDISKVSETQAYKQAGNSIVVQCLVEIISNFKL